MEPNADTYLLGNAAQITGTIDGGSGNDELVITTSDNADTVTIGAPVIVRNGVQTRYLNIDTVTLNTLGGIEMITVNPAAAGFPTRVNVNSGNDADTIAVNLLAGVNTGINVDGGEPSAGDSLIVNGTSAADVIAVNGLGVSYSGMSIGLSRIENLNVAAGDGNDSITLSGATVTGGVQLLGEGGDDSMTLTYPITAGSLSADGGAGANNTLVVNLTNADDAVTLNASSIQIAGGLTAQYGNFASLTLNSLGGADNVHVLNSHAGITTLNLGAGSDTLTIDATSGLLNADAGSDNDMLNIHNISFDASLSLGTGDDSVNVSSTANKLDGIKAKLTVVDGGGNDTLNVIDSGDTLGQTGSLSGSQLTGLGMTGSIVYAALETLNVSLGSGSDSFTVLGTHSGVATVNANGGADVVNVQSTSGATTVNAGDGSDTINIRAIGAALTVNAGNGDDAINAGSLSPATGGTVNAIGALLTVNGDAGTDVLNVDDSGDGAANAGTLTATSLTGLGLSASGLTYGTFEALNIGLGVGGDTFTIAGTHTGTTSLNASAGADSVTILGTAGATTVNSGNDSDTVNVRAIGAALTVNAGDGTDIINVGSNAPASNGNVNAIGALLTVNGDAGADTLNVDDTGDSLTNTGTLTATSLSGLGLSASGLSYGTLEALNIGLGSGGDTFMIAGTHAGAITLDTNAGADTVIVWALPA